MATGIKLGLLVLLILPLAGNATVGEPARARPVGGPEPDGVEIWSRSGTRFLRLAPG